MQLVAVWYRDLLSPLFWIVRVVENRNKLDAAMPKLREAECAAVPRIECRGSVIRRKEDEGVEQLEHTLRPSWPYGAVVPTPHSGVVRNAVCIVPSKFLS